MGTRTTGTEGAKHRNYKVILTVFLISEEVKKLVKTQCGLCFALRVCV